jgi:hypothetical protein
LFFEDPVICCPSLFVGKKKTIKERLTENLLLYIFHTIFNKLLGISFKIVAVGAKSKSWHTHSLKIVGFTHCMYKKKKHQWNTKVLRNFAKKVHTLFLKNWIYYV